MKLKQCTSATCLTHPIGDIAEVENGLFLVGAYTVVLEHSDFGQY